MNATAPDPRSPSSIARYRENRQSEIDSAFIYEALAEQEDDPAISGVYRNLAATETTHIEYWETKLKEAGAQVPPRKPAWRARALRWLARKLGTAAVLPTLMENESGGTASYLTQPETASSSMPAEERSHQRVLRTIRETSKSGMEGPTVARLEGRHRAAGGNALRAAVLGANDGLVSNLSLVMGVAGAKLPGQGVLITGLAGLLAGAGSMALGEWLSVQSSRELYMRQIGIEKQELETSPAQEAEELALIYQAKGIGVEESKAIAERVIASPEKALDTLAREELGIDPEALGGSAWEAAITSFLLFATGAILPVLPFIFTSGNTAVIASVALSAVGLFGIGSAITLMTGRGVLFSGARQLVFGIAAAALTFLVGRLIGASLAG